MWKTISLIICTSIATAAHATNWELKQKIKYRDSHQTSELKYKKSGKFDKETVKEKNRWRSEVLLTATSKTTVDELDWVWRIGYKFERKDDSNRQFKEDGSLKKDKSRVEYERTKLMGLGLNYKKLSVLGADRWVIKTHFDNYFDIDLSTGHLAEDAKGYHGSTSGLEFCTKFTGEYSTGAMGWFITPMLMYRERGQSSWSDEQNDKFEPQTKERRTELGLWVNWLMPIDGIELFFGPVWQREKEGEKQTDTSWKWEKEQRTYAHLMLEYEAPSHGLEVEFKVQHIFSGDSRHDTRYKFEISYEF